MECKFSDFGKSLMVFSSYDPGPKRKDQAHGSSNPYWIFVAPAASCQSISHLSNVFPRAMERLKGCRLGFAFS